MPINPTRASHESGLFAFLTPLASTCYDRLMKKKSEFKWYGRELEYAYQRFAHADVKTAIRESAELLTTLANLMDKNEHFNEVERMLKRVIPTLTEARLVAARHDTELRIRTEGLCNG